MGHKLSLCVCVHVSVCLCLCIHSIGSVLLGNLVIIDFHFFDIIPFGLSSVLLLLRGR